MKKWTLLTKLKEKRNEPPAPTSHIAELNETLNLVRAFNTIRRDANNSGAKVQETLNSVLHKDPPKRLNSLVLVTSQDRESVITRTPSQSSQSSDCSEISSINSEVFVDSESFHTESSYSIKQPPIAPPDRNVQKLTPEKGAMDAAEEEIGLRSRALANKLEAYPPNGITEMDIEDKIYLAKAKEIDRILEDVLDQVKRNMTSNSIAPLAHGESEAEPSLKRRKVEAMERANTIAESESAQSKRNEREKAVLKAKSIYDNVMEDVRKLDKQITKIGVDEWSDEEDISVSKGMRNLDKWEGDLKEITTMFRELKALKIIYDIQENDVRCEFAEVEVKDIEKVFNKLKDKLEAEDEERGL